MTLSVMTTLTTCEVKKLVVWKTDPVIYITFWNNFSSMLYRSRVIRVFLPTANDVITISGMRDVRWKWKRWILNRPISGTIFYRWSLVSSNVCCISDRLRVIRCLISKGEFALLAKHYIGGFLPHAFETLSGPDPQKPTFTYFEPS